jgi:hypothetical protein
VPAIVLPYKCHNCGQYFGPPSACCPHCSCDSWDTTVSVQGVEGKAAVGQVGSAARSLTESRDRIQYTSPVGTESDSEVNEGMVRLELRGTGDIGTRGDTAVLEKVKDALRAQGHMVEGFDAQDDRGEDGKLKCDGQTVIVQVVTAPTDEKLMRDAANGVAQTEQTRSVAAGWLERAIDSKAMKYDPVSKGSMLLAIDVRHMGVVVNLIDANLRAKASTAGFRAVWLIGPTTETTVMLS